ncbi:MAG: DUF1929 domain-containing protein [Planctomycetes bacterium]|nr:DUF1929 domain-containing protein [Planctomycetota bacterium]
MSDPGQSRGELRSKQPSPSHARISRALSVLAVALASGSTVRGQGAADVGAWTPVDWHCDSVSLEPTFGARVRMFHGALIPHGPYQGSVLTFGKYADSTVTFVWIPTNPTRLYRVKNSWGGAPRHVDSAALAWDDEGQLVIVAPQFPGGGPLSHTWRLFPTALNFPPIDPLPTLCTSSWPEIRGDAWRQLPNLSVARYRPALFVMANGLIPSSARPMWSLLLGGALTDGSFQPVNDGHEFWQALSPRSTPGGSSWSATFVPSLPPANPNTLPPGTPTETYVVQPGITESKVQAAPCAVQMANSGLPSNQLTKASFVAQDSLVSYTTPPLPAAHAAGLSSIVRPRYEVASESWELHPAGGTPGVERSQGSVVVRHDRAGLDESYSGKNRVFSIGGLYHLPTSGWSTLPGALEYVTPAATSRSSGQWAYLNFQGVVPFPVGRIDNNAVVLPTGDILVVGGSRIPTGTTLPDGTTPDQVSLHATPILAPQLLRVGPQGSFPGGPPPGGALWSVTTLATAPVQPNYGVRAPRGHGHSAVLLPDGRVLVSGGETGWTGTPGLAFTGEIFAPPYLFQGFRPTIASLQGSSFAFGAPIALVVGRLADEVIDAVVLLRPASTAYGFDSSQRYIELEFSLGAYDPGMGTQDVLATAPSDDLGPAGHYLIFVVSHREDPTRRVPSVGQFLRLQ